MDVEAVTLDFFNTLVRHPEGLGGRGKRVMAYLKAHGIASRPWQHQVLYDVFQQHAREYSPAFTAAEKDRYHVRIAQRLFRRLGIDRAGELATEHAAGIWQVIGPASLDVFPDVQPALEALRSAGFRLGVVSNWQCGLAHFCTELGLGDFFDAVVASAELGIEKPDTGIFEEACRRLGTEPGRVLHVGDSQEEDVEGARAAGLRALLLRRDAGDAPEAGTCIRTLEELPTLVAR